MKNIHIYIYENLINGKVYIGQTNDLKRRDKDHTAGRNIIRSSIFEQAIQKYGRENFSLSVITTSTIKHIANEDEKYWIAKARELLGIKNVYNISNGGQEVTSWIGRKHSEETKKKISNAKMGKKRNYIPTQEYLDGISKRNKGKIVSQETREKQSVSQKKRIRDPKSYELRTVRKMQRFTNEIISSIIEERKLGVSLDFLMKKYKVGYRVLVCIINNGCTSIIRNGD